MSAAFSLFTQFFVLGLTSFGGPAAHLGYFRTIFVEQKKWLSDSEYSQLIALSQFLPGPGSSQVGFAIGMQRMGILGGILAFVGFTLPSFILMLALAMGVTQLTDTSYLDSFIHMFKLLAVVVVLDAVLTMGKSFCQQTSTLIIALSTCILIWLIPLPQIQIVCLVLAGLLGLWRLGKPQEAKDPIQFKLSFSTLAFISIFIICLLGILPIPALFSETFVAGSLVFGGGHVVLPLLQDYFAHSIGQENFITGYAAAQAVPGPMFTFATYLGALSHENALLGATIATAGIFLPGFLLVLAFYKNWNTIAGHPKVSGVIAGINASVVGLLAATLYDPIFVTSVLSVHDMAMVAVGFALLRWLKRPIIQIIAIACLIAIAKVLLGF
jgi:chromate transporter